MPTPPTIPARDRPTGLRRRLIDLRTKLRARPDSEHEIFVNRVAISVGFLIYMMFVVFTGRVKDTQLTGLVVAFTVFDIATVLLFWHLLRHPGISVWRRIVAIMMDLWLFSYVVHIGDSNTALLYPIYLWSIFGNGFRFGIRYLIIAAAAGVIGFGAVVLATPFWHDHLSLGIGLLAGLIILPAYVSTLIRKLSDAKQQAETANQAKSMFLASVSHELRTPLNAIIGLSDLMGDSPLTSDQGEMNDTIGQAGRSLLRHINGILDLSRLEAGRMPDPKAEVDLFAFLYQVRSMLSVQAHSKGLRFLLTVDADTPRYIVTSSRHLEEILVNLSSNAVKFTAQGAVSIRIRVLAKADASVTLRFEVADTGTGIAPQAQSRIFEEFTQADDTIIDTFGGTGLGLAIVKKLVESQNGRIGVESALGQGSLFWTELSFAFREDAERVEPEQAVALLGADPAVEATLARFQPVVCPTPEDVLHHLRQTRDTRRGPFAVLVNAAALPDPDAAIATLIGDDVTWEPVLVLIGSPGDLAPSHHDIFVTALKPTFAAEEAERALQIVTAAARRRLAPSLTTARSQPLSILVAEDNLTNQKVIKRILGKAGHRITIADDGAAALVAMRQGGVDLVLMDVNMPVQNGIEATRAFRQDEPPDSHLLIVALTADASHEAEARCRGAGMDAIMQKPIEPAKLLAYIDGLGLSTGSPPDLATPDEAEVPVDDPLAEEPPINARALRDLEALGGREFVDEIVSQFVSDAALVLRNLSQAVAGQDVEMFRDQAHALRSCAANVGAQRIYHLCLAWREIGAHELAAAGAEHLERLQVEFDDACRGLNDHVTPTQEAA